MKVYLVTEVWGDGYHYESHDLNIFIDLNRADNFAKEYIKEKWKSTILLLPEETVYDQRKIIRYHIGEYCYIITEFNVIL